MWWLLLAGTALAATPNPDRPSVSRSGWLVAPDTLELELGFQWAAARSVPATLKYAISKVVEPRVSADLSGVNAGAPGLEAGAKFGLFQRSEFGFAVYAGSAVPVSTDEPWFGRVHALFTADLDGPFVLQVNAGLDLAGDGGGGVATDGVPLVGLFGWTPTGKLTLFAELAGKIGAPGCEGATCAYGRVVIDGGVGFQLTEILIVDAGAGWDLYAQQPYATVGMSANFGSVR